MDFLKPIPLEVADVGNFLSYPLTQKQTPTEICFLYRIHYFTTINSFGALVKTWQPFSVINRSSSIRTPYCSGR